MLLMLFYLSRVGQSAPSLGQNSTILGRQVNDVSCTTSKPNRTISCKKGCFKASDSYQGQTLYMRRCSLDSEPTSGCKTLSGGQEQCYCSTDKSYPLSYPWILVGASLIISATIQHKKICNFNHY